MANNNNDINGINDINKQIKKLKQRKSKLIEKRKQSKNTDNSKFGKRVIDWQQLVDKYLSNHDNKWKAERPRIPEVNFKSLIAKYKSIEEKRIVLRICSSDKQDYDWIYQTVLMSPIHHEKQTIIRNIKSAWSLIDNKKWDNVKPEVHYYNNQALIIIERYSNSLTNNNVKQDISMVIGFLHVMQ